MWGVGAKVNRGEICPGEKEKKKDVEKFQSLMVQLVFVASSEIKAYRSVKKQKVVC